MDEIERLIRSLLRGEFALASLTFNEEHAINYTNARDWYASMPDDPDEWVSLEEREAALEQNSVWTLQWYPVTPNGFHCLRASSLAALLAGVEKFKREEAIS